MIDNPPPPQNDGPPQDDDPRVQAEERIMEIGLQHHLASSKPRDFRESVLAELERRKALSLPAEDDRTRPQKEQRILWRIGIAAGLLMLLAVGFSQVFDGWGQKNQSPPIAAGEEEREHFPVLGSNTDSIEATTIQELVEYPDKSAANIRYVRLAGYEVDDKALAELAKRYPNVYGLDITDANISDAGLKHLKSLKLLRDLGLRECRRITDKGMLAVGELPELSMLSVTGFVGQTASIGGNFKPKKTWGQPGSRLTDDAWKGIVKLKKLTHLSMEGSNVGDQFLLKLALEGSQVLKFLRLNDTKLSDRNLALFHTPWEHGEGKPMTRTFPKLTHLFIRNARISDKGIEKFVQFLSDTSNAKEVTERSRITNLYIGGNGFNDSKITGKGLALLGQLPALKIMDIKYATRFDEKGWAEFLKKSKTLQHLRLQDVAGTTSQTLKVLAEEGRVSGLSIQGLSMLDDAGLAELGRRESAFAGLSLLHSKAKVSDQALSRLYGALVAKGSKNPIILKEGNQPHLKFSPNRLRVLATDPTNFAGLEGHAVLLDSEGKCAGFTYQRGFEGKFAWKNYEGPSTSSLREAIAKLDAKPQYNKAIRVHDFNTEKAGKYQVHFVSDTRGFKSTEFGVKGQGLEELSIEWPKQTIEESGLNLSPFVLDAEVDTSGLPYNWRIMIHREEKAGRGACALFTPKELLNKEGYGKIASLNWAKGEQLYYTIYRQGYAPATRKIKASEIREDPKSNLYRSKRKLQRISITIKQDDYGVFE